ncbi:hypothetical protein DJ568_01710 [Mucilaginibacter hurinus]|uniref:Uncharacterized protein n=1 Tax=Mucilaginibacter hurinus TaxID=2201324 RepID=A0A367GUZ1_9SPHI|nr:DUF6263 family protein [Mucilaginibacter hurinus]RCH56601.1 hypothetical protein DJ568_01710 [Mucilaginibacter hurinus]
MKYLCTCILLSIISLQQSIAQKIPVTLTLALQKVYRFKASSKTTTVQYINGNKLENELSTVATITFAVVAKQDSMYTLAAKYDSLYLKIDLPVGFIEASSTIIANDIYSRALAKLKGKQFLIRLNTQGHILKVNGLNDSLTNAVLNLHEIPADQREQASKQLLQSFGADSFKSMVEPYTYIFPLLPVALNNTWVINQSYGAPVPVNARSLYRLKAITPKEFAIEGTSLLTDNDESKSELNDMPILYTLGGAMSVNLKIDRAGGWIKQANVTSSIKGNMRIIDNANLPGGILIPVSITRDISVNAQ